MVYGSQGESHGIVGKDSSQGEAALIILGRSWEIILSLAKLQWIAVQNVSLSNPNGQTSQMTPPINGILVKGKSIDNHRSVQKRGFP